MNEIWVPIVGWESLYEVSSLGRVRSVDRTIMRRSKKHDSTQLFPWRFRSHVLKPVITGSIRKYPAVHLQFQGKRVEVPVSHLVAASFNTSPVSYTHVKYVRYKDHDPTNCALSNLHAKFI